MPARTPAIVRLDITPVAKHAAGHHVVVGVDLDVTADLARAHADRREAVNTAVRAAAAEHVAGLRVLQPQLSPAREASAAADLEVEHAARAVTSAESAVARLQTSPSANIVADLLKAHDALATAQDRVAAAHSARSRAAQGLKLVSEHLDGARRSAENAARTAAALATRGSANEGAAAKFDKALELLRDKIAAKFTDLFAADLAELATLSAARAEPDLGAFIDGLVAELCGPGVTT